MTLTAEALLAGSALTHRVEVPPGLLGRPDSGGPEGAGEVTIRPLTVRDVQRISRAAGDDVQLSGALMIQQSIVDPPLSLDQAAGLPAGLARFLLDRINEVSGMDPPADALAELVQAPLARACFVLAKEFGWTPEEVSGMTIGQILLYLEMAGHAGGRP